MGDVPTVDCVTRFSDVVVTGVGTDVFAAEIVDDFNWGVASEKKVNCVKVVALKFTFILPINRLLYLNKMNSMYVLLTQPVGYEFEIKFLIVIKSALSSIHSPICFSPIVWIFKMAGMSSLCVWNKIVSDKTSEEYMCTFKI